jgi:hypothetical protein
MPQSRRMASYRLDSSLRLRAIAALTVLVLVIAGCQATASPSASPGASPDARPSPGGTSSPRAAGSPAPTADPSDVYAAIEEQVTRIRGLEAKNPVDPIVLDDAGIKKLTAETFRSDNPEELVAANERLLKGLGLLEEDASLEDLYVTLLGDQVAGLYSPDDKKMYVVSRSGALGPTEKSTFSHEFTHALQDQNFSLDSLDLTEVGEGDRAIGRLALVEGDATLAMSYWQIENLKQMELLQLIGESLNPAVSASLNKMPRILKESLLFPYTGGLAFVQALQAAGGWDAINDAYANPPASTEQVLHPEKYVAGEEPVDVTLPEDLASRMGEGWKVGLEDTFGEFQLRVWLDQVKPPDGGVKSSTAADGWGGDRIALLDGPNGERAVALVTAWDTTADAADFAAAAERVIASLDGAGELVSDGGSNVTVLLGGDAGIVDDLKRALAG